MTDTLTHFHPGNFHQRKCHPRTSDKIKTFHPKIFHPRYFQPRHKCHPRKWQTHYHVFIQKASIKKMSSQQKWHMMTCHPRNFIPEASYGMYEEFFIQEIGWLYIGKAFWYGKVISFILTTVYSPNETVFIHPFFFSSRSIVIRWIIKV